MLNGLQMSLKNAIEYVGGKVEKSDCLWEYPEIIKNSLTSINNIGGNTVQDSDTVEFTVEDNKISAHVSYITDEQIESIQ
jgi:hypothetical protein